MNRSAQENFNFVRCTTQIYTKAWRVSFTPKTPPCKSNNLCINYYTWQTFCFNKYCKEQIWV